MAETLISLTLITFLLIFLTSSFVISQPPPLNSLEQESVYRVLESLNSDYPWRSLFPDDLCSSAPHGVVCDYFTDSTEPHITQLNFGYVSDYSPNPPCNSNSTLNPSLLTPLSHLKKLFFYKCFTDSKTTFPDFSPLSKTTNLQELIFIENPSLFGSIEGKIGGLTNLTRLILTGSSNVSGSIPNGLVNLEQLTLSRNGFEGKISMSVFDKMKKLKVLDLSENNFNGNVPVSIGSLSELLKLDLSYNGFSGEMPETLKGLKRLEFMDLSYNKFGNFGLPLFLGEMSGLKELYLSGNLLGGHIPEIWRNLGGIKGIGMSKMGLIGNIPNSMGVHLRNICYLGLDNNKLKGVVPQEFTNLEFVSELNLENNSLSGRIPFSSGFVDKLGAKLKLEGNLDLCFDEGLLSTSSKLKLCRQIPQNALFYHQNSTCTPLQVSSSLFIFLACFLCLLLL